jgi:signal transduction protein with GAF and PtsI domain
MRSSIQAERADTKERLYYQQDFFGIFREIMRRISSTKRSMKAVDIITEHAAKSMGVKGSALMLLDRKKRVLEAVSSYGLSARYLRKGPVSSDRSIREGMAGAPVCVDDVKTDPRIQYPQEAAREGICSILSAPILFKKKVIGVLRIYTSIPTEFAYEDVQFVQGLADLAALVIEYNRLVMGVKHSLEALKTHKKKR